MVIATIASIVFLVVLGLIPSFAWLVFYLREDIKHPEPKKLILFTFLLGAAVTFVVLPIQVFTNSLLSSIGVQGYGAISFAVLGFIEEFAKFFVIYLFIHKRKEFDEPLHAMIYMIVAALGFAAVENIASLIQVSQGSIFNVAILQSISLRFVGATLLHALASGMLGYFWGKAFIRGATGFRLSHRREWGFIIKGLLIATVLHALFNYLIITTGPATVAVAYVVLVAFFLLNDFEKYKKEDTFPSTNLTNN
jgi:protease PrsW